MVLEVICSRDDVEGSDLKTLNENVGEITDPWQELMPWIRAFADGDDMKDVGSGGGP
jgi:hypothetical protein